MSESKKPKNPYLDALSASQPFADSLHLNEILGRTTGRLTTVESALASLEGLNALSQVEQLLGEKSASISMAAIEMQHLEEMTRHINPISHQKSLLSFNCSAYAELASGPLNSNLSPIVDSKYLAAQEFSKSVDIYRDIAKIDVARFYMPKAAEVSQLLANIHYSEGAMAAYARQQLGATQSQWGLLSSLSHPWMSALDSSRSMVAIMELHGLGTALNSMNGFDSELTVALRVDLGDWRDKITFPEKIFEDPIVRTEFYLDRGFNPALTDFPEETFQESLRLFGLDEISNDEIQLLEPLQSSDPTEELAYRRNNKCYNILQRLERRLRHFINEAMTEKYGEDWPRKRLPPNIRDDWEEKKTRGEKSGVAFGSIIDAADFTHYELIICRRDNWREVFEGRFQRMESVRESFQRLYPIRLATMHGRFVTKEDELYLIAESTRLFSALGRL